MFAACASAPKPLAAPAVSDHAFTFGFHRQTGEEAAQLAANKLSAYLGAKFGEKVVARVFDTPSALGDALATGHVDAGWMSPGAYVKAAHQGEVEPVLKLSRGGFGRYRSVFFTKAGAPWKSLDELRGKSLAILGESSMSGRLFPMAYLKKHGIDAATFFGKLIEAKDHADSCRLVLEGKADAGVTLSDYRAPDELVADGCAMGGMDPDKFNVVTAVGPIPNDIIAVRAGLDGALRDKLVDALNDMRKTEAGRAQMREIFQADGFVPTSDTDFVVVRELEQFMGD